MEDSTNVPENKRPRISNEAPENSDGAKIVNPTLGNLKFVKVLKEFVDTKSVFLLAKCEATNEDAVVILEKEAFGEENSKAILAENTRLKEILKNDIYGTYAGHPEPDLNSIKVTVIQPATSKHIDKYSAKKVCFLNETFQLYQDVVKPFLLQNSFSHKWVYNILNHETESERILFEDPNPETGFMLMPDMKWSGLDPTNLYVLALVFSRKIGSLRDLTNEHLPLLKNIKEKTMKTIETKWGILADSIRAYIHYQPSYYHFHVHFNLITNYVPGTQLEKAHLLDTVISNIENYSDYYQKVTLSYVLPEDNDLYREIKSKT